MVRAACHIRPKCCIRTRQNATLIPVVAWHVIEGFDVRSLRTCAQTDRLFNTREQRKARTSAPKCAGVRMSVASFKGANLRAGRCRPLVARWRRCAPLAAVHAPARPEGSYLASYRGTRRPQGLAQSCTTSRRTGARPRRGLLVRPGRTKS